MSIKMEDKETISMAVLNMRQPMKNWIIVAVPLTLEELYVRISRIKHGYDETVLVLAIGTKKNPRKTTNHPSPSNEINYTIEGPNLRCQNDPVRNQNKGQ